MTYSVVTLFDHPDHANEAMRVLEAGGFDGSHLHSIESDPESQNFFKRVFSSDGGEELEADMAMTFLTSAGIPEDEAEEYAESVEKGQSLILVENQSERQAQKARKLISEHHFEDLEETDDEQRRRGEADVSRRQRPEGRTGQTYAESGAPEGREAVEDEPDEHSEFISGPTGADSTSDEPLTGQTPTSSFVGSEDESDEFGREQLVDSGDRDERDINAYVGRADARYQQFEPELRTHYEETFATDDDYGFAEYSRGYRYGMALAEDDEYHGRQWEDVEREAGHRWEAQEASSWDNFKEAVRYGWYKIRGEEEDYERRPPR